jgi:N-acetylneuraminic acid mutarotase
MPPFGLAGYDQYSGTEYSNALVKLAHWASGQQASSGRWVNDHDSYPTNWGNVQTTARFMVAISQAMQRVSPATAQQYQAVLDKAATYLRNNMNNTSASYNGDGMPYNDLVAWAIVGLKAAGPGASGENTTAVNALASRLLARTSSPTGAAWGATASHGADPTSTGTVLYALCLAGLSPGNQPVLQNAINWLKGQQAPNGSFGSGATIDIATTFAELGLSCFGDYSVNISTVGANSVVLASGSPESQTVTYTFNVQNRGYLSDLYALAVQGVPSGWSAVMSPTSVTLAPAAEATVTLTVSAPPNLVRSLSIPMTVTATSAAVDVSASTRVTTYTDPPPPTTGTTGTTTTTTILYPGANATFTVGQSTTLTARVKNSSTGSWVVGPGKGVVSFYIAGVTIGSDEDADGDGVYAVPWNPDSSSWTASGAQDYRAVYSGVTLPAPQTNLLGSVASQMLNIHIPPVAITPIPGTEPGFPATPFPYAASAITVTLYPPTEGQPVTLGVLLQNPTSSPVTITGVSFAVSGYGLGLSWQPVGSVSNVIIPAATMNGGETLPGTVHPTIQWVPPFSGHHCVRVTLHFADGRTQVIQRNIDILGISNGGPNTIDFNVGNPTDQTATITLKLLLVVQSPTGWTASLNRNSLTLAPGAWSTVNLSIYPPAGAPPGSYATFNVEGYIGSTLIGGISKTVVIGGLAPSTVFYPPANAYLPGSFIVRGTALPYAQIVCRAGTYVFRTIADVSGNWTLPVTMASGGYTLRITQELGSTVSGPWGGGIPITVVTEGVPPVGNLAIQGVPRGGITRIGTPTFSGTGIPGYTVVISSRNPATGVTTQFGTATVGADGLWVFTAAPQPDSNPTYTAIQVDSNGNRSLPTAGYTILIDLRPPTIVIEGAQECSAYSRGFSPVVRITDLNPRGTTETTSGVNPQSVFTTLNGQPYTSGTPFTEPGWYTLVVTAADNAGNTSSQVAQFSVDSARAPSALWSSTSLLPEQRVYHSATELRSGKVLVAGGWSYNSYLATAVLYDPFTATWASTGAMATPRQAQTATLLPSGKVLVMGGENSSASHVTATAELYDPATGTWSQAGSTSRARGYSTATLLLTGRVLVAGGLNPGGAWSTVDLYDSATGTWSSAAPLTEPRRSHTATLLPSGKVLVAGGWGLNASPSATAEVYDPATGTWTPTGSLATARYEHTATLLPSGKVLVTGGQNQSGPLATAELYDPASGTWSSVSPMAGARYLHTATLINGKVLVAGGLASGALSTAEQYDPATGTWSTTASMVAPQGIHPTTLLSSINKVLITGGWSGSLLRTSALYEPGASCESTVAEDGATSVRQAGVTDGSSGSEVGSLGVYERIGMSCSTTGSGGPMMTLVLLLLAFSSRESRRRGLESGTARVSMAGTRGLIMNLCPISSSTCLCLCRVRRTTKKLSLIQLRRMRLSTGSCRNERSFSMYRLKLFGFLGAILAFNFMGCSSTRGPPEDDQLETRREALSTNWQDGGVINHPRHSFTMTVLDGGKALAAGGRGNDMIAYRGYLSSAELYDPAASAWIVLDGGMASSRMEHAAALLPSNLVLVVGGFNDTHLATAELFNPVTGTWSDAGSMQAADGGTRGRSWSTATLLSSGQVVVAGGLSHGGPQAQVDIYNPETGVWTVGPDLSEGRWNHGAVPLPSGQLLVAGGFLGGPSEATNSAELYIDADGGYWTDAGSMTTARGGLTATLLPSGRILVAGGRNDAGVLASAELYNPVTGAWEDAGFMSTPRYKHTANLVAGKVLVTGGLGDNETPLASTEVYDPDTGAWSIRSDLPWSRGLHSAVVLDSVGQVLVTGGWGPQEYSPGGNGEIRFTALYDTCNLISCDQPPGQCHNPSGTCSNGTCFYSPKANGTPCDDGNAATSGDACDGSGSCVGVICNNPPSDCHNSSGTYTDGTCSYSVKPAGTPCGSGLVCNTFGGCIPGCWIGGAHYASGATNPSFVCEVCNPSLSTSSWSFASNATVCRDQNGVCDVAEHCTGSSNACPVDGFATSGTGCTSDSNACTQDVCNGAGTCTHPQVPAGTSCGSGLVCDTSGGCIPGCWIGGAHYASGATNPSATCQMCDPGQSTSSWSNKLKNTSCDDGNLCTSGDVCTGLGECGGTKAPVGTSCGSELVCSLSGQCGCNPLVSSECFIRQAYRDVLGRAADLAGEKYWKDELAASGCLDGISTRQSDPESCWSKHAGIVHNVLVSDESKEKNKYTWMDHGLSADEYQKGYITALYRLILRREGFISGGEMNYWQDFLRSHSKGGTPIAYRDLVHSFLLHYEYRQRWGVSDGSSCGEAQSCAGWKCNSGQCQSGCWIDNIFRSSGETNPGAACQVCNPSQSRVAWSFKSNNTICRASAGTCDVAEYCTGTSSHCPADAKQPSTTVCRGTTGSCDVAEYCTGSSNACPVDGFAASGTSCTSDSNACTQDVCNGAGTCTHPQVPAGTSCGSGLVCNTSGGCIPGCWIGGAHYASGTTNPSAACQVCDPSQSTSSWSFKPANTMCRASAGTCDVAEYCTGTSSNCPADAKQSSTTACRGATGPCDVTEYCTGSSNSCPADGFASSGTICTSDSNACTRDVCNGTGVCTHLVSAGTSCGSGLVCNGSGSECFIQQTYLDVLDHGADLAAINYWKSNLPSCNGDPARESACWSERAGVVHNILISGESQARHSGLNSSNWTTSTYQEAFIRALYNDLLRRQCRGATITQGEIDYWKGNLSQGGYSSSAYRGLVHNFLLQSEYRQRWGAQ